MLEFRQKHQLCQHSLHIVSTVNTKKWYITGTTSQTFCQKDISVWTGLRKYKIDNYNTVNDSCYIIQIHQDTINYKKKICTKNKFFFVKKKFFSITIYV